MSAVDELDTVPDEALTTIGPEQNSKNTVDMKNHFGAATAPGYTPVSQDMQAKMGMNESQPIEINKDDPLWANTVKADPLLSDVQGVSNIIEANCASMKDGSSYVLGKACEGVTELAGGICDLLKPSTPPQQAIADPQQQMQMQMAMQMRPSGGMFS